MANSDGTIPCKYSSYQDECWRCKGHIKARGASGSDYGDDNQLCLIFDGGYGWFIDNIEGPEEQRSVVLCHDCAHKLCDWLGIDPTNWHSHRVGEKAKLVEEGHRGWDLPNPDLRLLANVAEEVD